MSIGVIVWLLALVAVLGAGWASAMPLGGVVLANIGCAAAGLVTTRQNTPGVRFGYYLAVAGLAAAIYLATRSIGLSLAAFAFGLPLHANEAIMRRFSLHRLQTVAGLVLGAALMLSAYREGWWLLSVALMAGFALMFSAFSLWEIGLVKRVLGGATIRVGEGLESFTLPYRDGGGTFELAAERGHYVLLCFVRGDWCPVCHVLMRIIVREAPVLKEHDVHVVLITPSAGSMDATLQQALGITTQMVIDEGAALARKLGLIEGKRQGEDVPLPVAVLVGPDGRVLDISRPDDVTAFTTESRIAQVLQTRAGAAAGV